MRSYGFTIPGSDSRFYLPKNPIPNSLIHLPINTQLPKPVFSSRKAFGFVRVKAAVSDGFLTEAPELSFYELLGIPESGSLVEIKQAYKQLARKYHPDVSPPGQVKEYTKRFIQVQEAYETLSDPRTRAMYDRDMARGLQLAFSARRRYNDDEIFEEKNEWKNRWQAQVSELKKRSMKKDAGEAMSWGARMRRRRDEL
ncbi:Chaperone protein dnaJ 20 chloroplastic [Quillaja saponaria]|uniref:Chaperone protein dnaJ 20 chloroplastic n=1 Tax=Quillaja saponaria TaxID=32244 RepID=A0AAD7LFH1_QUISA|nr:Chaperone protein dnaJ 20 chloroplastic [Quillaja saponaria]